MSWRLPELPDHQGFLPRRLPASEPAGKGQAEPGEGRFMLVENRPVLLPALRTSKMRVAGYGVVQSDNGKKFKKGQRVVRGTASCSFCSSYIMSERLTSATSFSRLLLPGTTLLEQAHGSST